MSLAGVAEIGRWWQAGGVATGGDIAGDVAGIVAGFLFAVFAGILIFEGVAMLVRWQWMWCKQIYGIADFVAGILAGGRWRQWSSLAVLPLFWNGEELDTVAGTRRELCLLAMSFGRGWTIAIA